MNGALKRFAPDYVSDPAKALYRIYRDTRFSKDKTPYKDPIAASFRHRFLGGEADGAGFYFPVSHKDVRIGGGIYMPTPGDPTRRSHPFRGTPQASSTRC